MKIETQYSYEKIWIETKEGDLVKMIAEEIGEDGADGTLSYIKSVILNDKVITVGSLRVRNFKG